VSLISGRVVVDVGGSVGSSATAVAGHVISGYPSCHMHTIELFLHVEHCVVVWCCCVVKLRCFRLVGLSLSVVHSVDRTGHLALG